MTRTQKILLDVITTIAAAFIGWLIWEFLFLIKDFITNAAI